jgi:hypothetical protein
MTEPTETTTTLTVTTPAAMTLLTPAEGALARALSIVVNDDADAEIATECAKESKRRWEALEQQRKHLLEPVYEQRDRILALFSGPQDYYKRATDTVRRKLADYLDAKAKKEREEQARRERAQREEAERLEREAKKAEERGNTELATAKREIAEQVALAPVQTGTTKTAEGLSSAVRYSAKCTDKATLVKAAARNPMLMSLLDVNQSALNAMARATKEAFAVPGCELEKIRDARVRA